MITRLRWWWGHYERNIKERVTIRGNVETTRRRPGRVATGVEGNTPRTSTLPPKVPSAGNAGRRDTTKPYQALCRSSIIIFAKVSPIIQNIFTYYSNNFTDYSSNLPLILTFNSIIAYVLSIRKVIRTISQSHMIIIIIIITYILISIPYMLRIRKVQF